MAFIFFLMFLYFLLFYYKENIFFKKTTVNKLLKTYLRKVYVFPKLKHFPPLIKVLRGKMGQIMPVHDSNN